MYQTNRNESIRVLIFDAKDENSMVRQMLLNVLKRAGLHTVEYNKSDYAQTEKLLRNEIHHLIEQTDCCIHIINYQLATSPEAKKEQAFSESVFSIIQQYSAEKKEDYKIFVWQPFQYFDSHLDQQQERFFNSIKNSVSHNIILSNHESPVVLAEDITLIMNSIVPTKIKVIDTELFFIYNELDDDSANQIIELLSDVMTIERLRMMQNSPDDYISYIVEQVRRSSLVVVYFKWAGDWAIPFVQQLWKLIGGASSETSILLIGDNSLPYNQNKVFTAPKVISVLAAEELIPLEIKVKSDNQLTNTAVL